MYGSITGKATGNTQEFSSGKAFRKTVLHRHSRYLLSVVFYKR
jgi:hypothetical protein